MNEAGMNATERDAVEEAAAKDFAKKLLLENPALADELLLGEHTAHGKRGRLVFLGDE
jgi:hypothetical protein